MTRQWHCILFCLAGTAVAHAQWSEFGNGNGDAGELPASAQRCTGIGNLPSISGFHDFDDADMFEFQISNEGAFTATVSTATTFDTQLFLFDAVGFGVTHHDDVSTTNRRSRLTSQFILSTGRYFLAISASNRDPYDNLNQLLWNDSPFTIERAPDGPGADSVVASWNDNLGGADSGGGYTINLTGASYLTGQPPCPGDVDGDRDVDLQDLATLLSNFGRTDSPPSTAGNLDNDSDVDLQDLATLLSNFGTICP